MTSERTRVKFCGLTCRSDIALAVAAGADAVGFILTESPRRVTLPEVAELARAVPPYVAKIGVVAGLSARDAEALRALGLTLQFNGGESAAECERQAGGQPYVKVFSVGRGARVEMPALEAYAGAMWMFDTHVSCKLGGTGVPFGWEAVEPVARTHSVIVAGGLTPDNVGACVSVVRPYAVDVRSGVETEGRKDGAKMRAFVRAVREADAQA